MTSTLTRLTRSTGLALGLVLLAGAFGPTWAHRGAQLPAMVAPARIAPTPEAAVPSAVSATSLPVRASLAVPAWIRVDPAATTAFPLASAAGIVLAVLVAGLLARAPRTLRLVLVLAVVVMATEGAIHGVHHLGDDQSAARCAVAAVCVHLAGTLVDQASVETANTMPQDLPLAEPAPRAARALRPDQGRSPPA